MKLVIFALFFCLALTGCPKEPSGNDGGPNSTGGGSAGNTGGGTGNNSGGGAGSTGGGSDNTGGSGGGGPVVTPDGGMAYAPQITMLDVSTAGRTGRDLFFSIKGKDRNLDATSISVRFLDMQGMPVMAFDANHDGIAEAEEGSLLLSGKKWVGETVTATATIKGFFAIPLGVTQVGVALVDVSALLSDEMIVTIAEQDVRARGEPCDNMFIQDRCAPGLGCRGTPTVCNEGLAPEISRMAFYKNTTGSPTVLIEGSEPEDDLFQVKFQFQNAQGQFISIDSDGDNTPDMASFDADALNLAVDGTYFIRLQPAEGLDLQVAKLVATPSDGAGHNGMPKIAAPSTIPVRSAGQACDARGFDTCGPSLTCFPGTIGASNKCSSAAPLRITQCGAAPVLVATPTGAKITAISEGGSLWDAPPGCSTGDPKTRPEGIVKVRLMDRANRLTVSTVGTNTTFDTTLYVLPGCPNDTVDNMGCSDDAPVGRPASELILTDVPAGDYLVVVDSFDLVGGTFELTATVE